MIDAQKDQFLWVEKYRPQTIDECILPESMKTTFKQYIEQGEKLPSVTQLPTPSALLCTVAVRGPESEPV